MARLPGKTLPQGVKNWTCRYYTWSLSTCVYAVQAGFQAVLMGLCFYSWLQLQCFRCASGEIVCFHHSCRFLRNRHLHTCPFNIYLCVQVVEGKGGFLSGHPSGVVAHFLAQDLAKLRHCCWLQKAWRRSQRFPFSSFTPSPDKRAGFKMLLLV